MWHPTKAALLKAFPDPPFIVSRDKTASGVKEFTAFKDRESLLQFLELSRGGSLYEVADGKHSCCMYCDIDRPVNQEDNVETDVVVRAFAGTFERFARDVYSLELKLDLGNALQVSCATRPGKVSLHARINVACSNTLHAKEVRANYEVYLRSCASTDEEKTILFTDDVDKDGKVSRKCIVDPAVYSSFQNIRTIYSHKAGKPQSTLRPYGASSSAEQDHLVFYAPNISDMPLLPAVDHPTVPVTKSKYSGDSVVIRRAVTAPLLPSVDMSSCLERITTIIASSPAIQSVIGQAQVSRVVTVSQLKYNFEFAPRSHACVYAGRCHKSNRGFLRYDHSAKTLTYRCYDPDCRPAQNQRPVVFDIVDVDEDAMIVADHNSTRTLHCRHSVIPWSVVYDSPAMRAYPDGRIVCVRAGMGSGKTRMLIDDFIPSRMNKPQVSGLFVTYSRTLANKYAKELADIGFVNYLDFSDDPVLKQNRLVVCLDSIVKVATKTFDYVFIDEALSVLLHFNSDLMANRVGHVIARFQDILVHAKHLFMLDACVDNAMVYNVVRNVAHHCGVGEVTWIRNDFVRPSNRTCTIFQRRCKNDALMADAADKVLELLRAGKRVVACSSIVKFTEVLNAKVQQELPHVKSSIYNSQRLQLQPSTTTHEWTSLDLLVYSPSISAGVSFEEPHFDQLVAYLVNSEFTASVDISLQMLFRVRQLRDGIMSIYVQDKHFSRHKCPMTDKLVDEVLDDGLMTLANNVNLAGRSIQEFAPTFTDDQGRLRYDKATLSYSILKGIVTNVHKSRVRYVDLLKSTLQEDYGVPCTVEAVRYDKQDAVVRCEQIKSLWKGVRQEGTPEFSQDLIVGDREYDELRAKKPEDMDVAEKTKVWIYECVNDVWQADPSSIDEAFYDAFIMPEKGRRKVFDDFYACLRAFEASKYSLADNAARQAHKLTSVDDNLALYQEAHSKYFNRLVSAQRIGIAVLGDDCFQRLWRGQQITVKSAKIAEEVANVVKSQEDAAHASLLQTFSLDPASYGIEALKKGKARKRYQFFAQIMRVAFAVDLSDVGSKKTSCKSYGDKRVTMPWRSIVDRYGMSAFVENVFD